MSADIMNFAGLYGAGAGAATGGTANNTNACKNIHMVYLENECASNANTTNQIFQEKAKSVKNRHIEMRYYKNSINIVLLSQLSTIQVNTNTEPKHLYFY